MRQISSFAPAKVLPGLTQKTRIMTTNMVIREKTSRMQLKTPKGTRDWAGVDIRMRDHIFESATRIFKRHGATGLDTPVFELKDVLTGKYGEDARLIYDLQDQGSYTLTPVKRILVIQKVVNHYLLDTI